MAKDKHGSQKKQNETKANHKSENLQGQELKRTPTSDSETSLLLKGDSLESQQSALQKLDTANRQKMIAEIGHVQGNHHVQRLVETLHQPQQERTNKVLQRELIPYSYAPPEIRESDVTNDPEGLPRARLEDLFILYGAGWRLHRLPPSGVVYNREWVLGPAGTALIRGYIRSKLNTKLDRPRLREWFLSRVEQMRGAADRKSELTSMILEAFARSGEGEQSRAEETSPVLADVGHQGRTFSSRGMSRDGTRDLSHRIHAGMDVPGPRGTGIYTPLDGRVIFAGQIAGFGNVVRILHETPPPTEIAGEGPVTTNYAHLDELLVSAGDTVSAGQAVGLMGNTRRGSRGGVGGVTRAMGVHLHFSVQRVPPGGPGRFSSRYEERDIRIRPDTWLRQLGVQITGVNDLKTEEATSPDVQREIHIQRYPNSDNDDPMHQPIIENYRRWRGVPAGGVDEFGQQVGPSDAEIKYGERRDSPLTQAEVEQRLSTELIRRGDGRGTDLSSEYIRAQLEVRRHNPDLLAAFNDAVQQVGRQSFDLQMSRIERGIQPVIQVLESQRRRLSRREWEALSQLSRAERSRRLSQLQSPQNTVSGVGGWLQYNRENLSEFQAVFAPLLRPLGLTVNNLLVLSSMMTAANPTYRELPPRDLWPNMQQTLRFLAHLGHSAGVSFAILSAYRSDRINALSGGVFHSAHEDFYGLDVRPNNRPRFEAFIKYYWHRRGRAHQFGLGFYRPGRVHIDTKRYRRWEWDENVSTSRARYQRVFGNTPLPD